MIDQLRNHFEGPLALPPAATRWLLDLWQVIQFLDDVVDNDPISKSHVQHCIFLAIAGLPSNPFFRTYSSDLLPLLANAVLKWKASDDAELVGESDAKSFVWRASYYDVVMGAVLICHGPEAASNAAKYVMQMYGESFDDYLKEFKHA